MKSLDNTAIDELKQRQAKEVTELQKKINEHNTKNDQLTSNNQELQKQVEQLKNTHATELERLNLSIKES